MSANSNVHVTIGDILDSEAQTLVNTVNTEGVMGKGIALQFRRRFPAMYEDYVERCARGEVELGRPYIFKGIDAWVINFPTKEHWRSLSRLEHIVAGLEYLKAHYRDWSLASLAVPPLGCGEGGLEWRVVGRVLYRYLREFDIPVTLYAPFGTPDEQLTPQFLESDVEAAFDRGPLRITPAWVAVVEILRRIEKEPYRWPVGRTMFHKVVYFATEEGLPTDMKFEQSSYGPFAPGLKRQQSRLMHNGLLTEERRGRMYAIHVGPAYTEALEAYGQELEKWHAQIDRIADLFLRLDTPQAEIAATVHFAATRLVEPRAGRPTEMDVLGAVRAWKMRRRPALKDEDIARMIRNLNLLGWLDLVPSRELPLPAHTLVDEFELQEA
jgi:O-acetyl-ADP-ribose deacetylase (regulator of RNase III)